MSRVAKDELRRWCPIAETHQDADDVWCGWDNCFDHKSAHRLRLRRMLICLECKQAYLKREAFNEHVCHSAY